MVPAWPFTAYPTPTAAMPATASARPRLTCGPTSWSAIALDSVDALWKETCSTIGPTALAAGIAASAVGPIVEQVSFHNASTESRAIADQDVGPHVNRGLALAVAGIAAVGVGYAVKGQAGTMIALGGGALALYGVYHWIK